MNNSSSPTVLLQMINLKTLVSLIALSATTLIGQEARPVQCRFVAVEETPGDLINAVSEGKEVAVKIMKGRISEPIECYAVEGRLNFLRADSRKPVASTVVPKNIKQAVLIFVKATEKGKSEWKILPFENTPKEFPAGGTRVVNLHSADIRFILGEENEILKPLQSKGFGLPKKRNDFNMAPVVFQFKNTRDEWINGKETSYRFLPSQRYLLVAYIDPRTKRPRVKTFKDLVRPKPAA